MERKNPNKPGAVRSLLQEISKCNLKIVAFQETKWLGEDIMDMKSHTICYSGKKTGIKEFCVAFVIKRDIKDIILDFKPINEKICTLRIKTKIFNVTLINVHAPTNCKVK